MRSAEKLIWDGCQTWTEINHEARSEGTMIRERWYTGVFIVTMLLLTACGSFSPPESCGAGGTADETKFTQHFTWMEIINEATGSTGEPDQEGGFQFSSSDELAITLDNIQEVSLRACVEERKGGGEIALDETQDLPSGSGVISLGSFEPGSYVVRVIVDGILVCNLPFSVTR